MVGEADGFSSKKKRLCTLLYKPLFYFVVVFSSSLAKHGYRGYVVLTLNPCF